MLCSPLVSFLIQRLKSRRLILKSGLFLLGMTMLVFSSVKAIENQTLILIFVLVNRFLQGFASSMIATTTLSIAAQLYPDKHEKIVGLV